MLELVERYEDLRVSDVVVVKPCVDCGGSHRGILVKAGSWIFGPYFRLEPKPQCVPAGYHFAVHEPSVREKVVYRERLPDVGVTEESATAKPKTRVLEDVGTRRGR